MSATAAPHSGRLALGRLASGPRARYVLGVALLVALYYGAARLGYEFEFAGPVAAIVWLPVGVGIAYLYLRGIRFWPGVLLGDLLANDYLRLPVGTALAQTVGNVLEVVLAAYLLRRAARSGYLLGRVEGLVRLLPPVAVATTGGPDRSMPSSATSRRALTRGLSTGCSSRRATASGWPSTGSTRPASPTRTGTTSTAAAT